MKDFKRFIVLFVILCIFWILFAGKEFNELILGFVASLIITILFYKKAFIFGEFNLNPKAIAYFVFYIFILLIEIIKSNIAVAKLVIQPTLPINPGIVKVKTKLKSRLGRIILANSITLTPGTLTIETKDDEFYIHWIDVTSENIDEATNSIVQNFEKYLEVIFG
ncbi:MAG: Na+/H+ antiporter subunit E [Candidatus Cloacimonetes bacterium]|nr:Na+/H+ antiporter subunit E [Candidatus Cloacimonadota bacterium]